jgi:serine/threonine protein kinase
VEFLEISGYKVIRQVAAGGMGEVFLVQHPRLPRLVAMKLLDPGVWRNGEFKARFLREADLLAQLSQSRIGAAVISRLLVQGLIAPGLAASGRGGLRSLNCRSRCMR